MDPDTYISLFSGAGGLDIAVSVAYPAARCIGYVEGSIQACEVLAARIAEGTLDDAPVWSDVRTFPGGSYRGRVGGIVAGFPCPDYSVAGKRAGILGQHGQLWDDLARVIGDVGPDWILLENVSGILVPHGTPDSEWVLPAGLWFVLGDLAALGFDAEWISLPASGVGASHGRMRWFLLAYRNGGRCGILRESSGRERFSDRRHAKLGHTADDNGWSRVSGAEAGTRSNGIGRGRPAGAGRSMGNTDVPGLERRSEHDGCNSGKQPAGAGGSELADTQRQSVSTEQQSYPGERAHFSEADRSVPRVPGSELPLFAPGPGERELWSGMLVRYPWLRPAVAQAEVEPHLRLMADGLADLVGNERTDALRLVGNGVVPLQAAVALVELTRRARKALNQTIGEEAEWVTT